MPNTIKKTTTSSNIISNNNYDIGSVDNENFTNKNDIGTSSGLEEIDLNEAVDNHLNDDGSANYELTSDTSTDKINDSSSGNIQESDRGNRNSTVEVSKSNSSGEDKISSVQNGVDTATVNGNKTSYSNSVNFPTSTQNGVDIATVNGNKTSYSNSVNSPTSTQNGVDIATLSSNKTSENNEMSQSSMNGEKEIGTSNASGLETLIGTYDNNPPVDGGNYSNGNNPLDSSKKSNNNGKNNGNQSENKNVQNINNNGSQSKANDNVSSSGNNTNGEWEILADEEYLKMYQELLDSIEKQIGTDGEISVLLREIRLKYVDYTIMYVDDGMDEKRLNEQIEQQIQANIDKVDQYVREHSDYNSYAELMQSKAEFENNKVACEQMIKYYKDKPIWEKYYKELEIAKEELPPQTGIAGERGLKGDPINIIHRIDSYEDQLIELFGENYKEVFAQYGLDLDFDYVQLYNYIYETEGKDAAEEFYKFAEDNIKSLAGLVDALGDTFLLSKDKWYSTAMNFITVHLEGMGTGVVSSFEGIMKWFQDNPNKTELDYQSMWYMLMLQTNEFGPEKVLSLSYQVGQGTGQMLPSIAISTILGILCPEGLVLPLGIALKGSTVAEIGASAYLFASTGGRDYAEQMQNGMSRDQAILHGLATGGLEITTEKLLGGLSVFGHESPTSLKKLFISMMKEGGQEVTQDLLSEILLGGGLPEFESKEEAMEYFKGKGMTFLVAALSAGEIEGPGAAVSIHNISEIYSFIDTGSMSEADLANIIRNNIDEDTSNMSDAEVIGNYNEACLSYITQMKKGNETEGNQDVIDPEKPENYLNEVNNMDNSSIEEAKKETELNKMYEMKELAFPVVELMKKNPDITFEQGKTLSEIYFNDNTIDVQYIVPSLANDVLRLQKMAMDEGMTLKEYGSQKAPDITSKEVQSQADVLAGQIRLLAEIEEPSITKDMKSLEKNGNYLIGLDKKLKSADSLSRKIISDATEQNISLEVASSKISDSIRYTLICGEDTFTDDVRDSLLDLQKIGYKIYKFKNKFNEKFYHGINVNLLTPDGRIIELQFHTEQSFLAKGKMTHLYYEIARNDFTSAEAKALADEIQKGVVDLVVQPEGVMELTEESVTLKQNDFEIDLSSNNVQQLLDTIYKVQDVTEIPVGYNTVEEYKKAFVSQLVNTKGFDSLRDPIIFELCCDPIMFEFLLENTDKIENLFIKNYYYEKNAEIINKNCLKKIDINEVNKLLNKPKMKEYLSSLSPTEMASLCNNFSYVYYNALSSSNALIDILCTYNVNQLIEFGKSLEYKFIPDDISKSFNRENVFKFYNYLINQIYVPNNAGYLKLLEYQLFKHIIPDLDSIIRKNDSSFIDINKQLYNKNKQLLQQTSNSVISNAELDGLFSRTPGDVFYKVDEPWKKYEVKYEVDGKEFTTVLKSDILDQINLTDLMQSPEVSDAISRNAFIIKDIRFVDTGAYERMKLTSESGLKEGINYVTCRIDGKLKKIIVSGDNFDLNYLYRDVNEFEIVNIDSIDSPNIVCNDTDIDKYLKVSYTIDGKEEVFYLSPSESDNQIVFNIADCIEQKHLFGATNFSTEIVDNVELTVNNIQELSSFNDIFNDIAYGGNQGDVPQIVFNYLKGNITNSIDKQKGKLMVDLIKSVFPSATDTEIVFIANHYAEVGCAYMSASNAFMTYITSLENGEEIFRERFGFDLKVSDSSTISYNLEALALDIYLRKVVQNKITLNSLGNIRRIDGVSKTTFHNDISGYFKEKGIILHYDRFSDGLNKNNAAFANMASNPNQMYILDAGEFNVKLDLSTSLISSDEALDLKNGKTINDSSGHTMLADEQGNLIISNIGGHSMLVTGIDEQGNLIVSTWGEKATIIGGKYQNDTTGLYEITSIWFEID